MTTINLSDTEPEPTEYSKKEVFDALSKIISGKDSKDKNNLDTLKKFTNNLESTDDSPKKDNEVIEISEVPKNKKNVSKTKIPKKTTKKMQKKISLEDEDFNIEEEDLIETKNKKPNLRNKTEDITILDDDDESLVETNFHDEKKENNLLGQKRKLNNTKTNLNTSKISNGKRGRPRKEDKEKLEKNANEKLNNEKIIEKIIEKNENEKMTNEKNENEKIIEKNEIEKIVNEKNENEKSYSTPSLVILSKLKDEFGMEKIIDTLCKDELDSNLKLDSMLKAIIESSGIDKFIFLIIKLLMTSSNSISFPKELIDTLSNIKTKISDKINDKEEIICEKIPEPKKKVEKKEEMEIKDIPDKENFEIQELNSTEEKNEIIESNNEIHELNETIENKKNDDFEIEEIKDNKKIKVRKPREKKIKEIKEIKEKKERKKYKKREKEKEETIEDIYKVDESEFNGSDDDILEKEKRIENNKNIFDDFLKENGITENEKQKNTKKISPKKNIEDPKIDNKELEDMINQVVELNNNKKNKKDISENSEEKNIDENNNESDNEEKKSNEKNSDEKSDNDLPPKNESEDIPSSEFTQKNVSIGLHFHKDKNGQVYKYFVHGLIGEDGRIFHCSDESCKGTAKYDVSNMEFKVMKEHSKNYDDHSYVINVKLEKDSKIFCALAATEKYNECQIFRKDGKRHVKYYKLDN